MNTRLPVTLATALASLVMPAHARKIVVDPAPAVAANTDFAFELYAQLAKQGDGNLFFSPFSISSALAMTAEGARGQTALEMGKVLELPNSARLEKGPVPWNLTSHHMGMWWLNNKFNRADQAFELAVANAVWGEQSFPFDARFMRSIQSAYGADALRPADFIGQPDAERERINTWVEDFTRERIEDLLPSGSIDPLTRMVLVNAIYFKGGWEIPFDRGLTRDRDFSLADGSKETAALMHAHNLEVARYAAFNADGSRFDTPVSYRHDDEPVFYPDADGFAMVELPYEGDKLSMLVIAPNDPSGLPAIESQLSREGLDKWVSALASRDVNLTLPKFKSEKSIQLKDALSAMGMPTAFDLARANFNGLSRDETEAKSSISEVFHKAFVEVNEEGTEAAAATAIPLAAGSAPAVIHFVPSFEADRPFLYMIRDKATGTILFLGRMMQP